MRLESYMAITKYVRLLENLENPKLSPRLQVEIIDGFANVRAFLKEEEGVFRATLEKIKK